MIDFKQPSMSAIEYEIHGIHDIICNLKLGILREIGELVSLMEEATECLCAPCCIRITNKYSEYIEPFMEKYKELERGDRTLSASNKSSKGTE